ncbi:MAG TPA: aminomethyl-transferring glycine dehydrogenase subunit GcvPB [Thermomicrobiales bacterium]|nr:aminomethyl-transferring glycine dehydrogenase subunit GcvPB [Thermomicrobiales bacterium]
MTVEPTIFELSRTNRRGVTFPAASVPHYSVPQNLQRERLDWPEVSEIDVVRHFTRMSQKNHAIDIAIYPLGSCTMKFNSRINEAVARMPGFASLHPLQDAETSQGAMQLMFELQDMLAEISGFDSVTLQPAAGAHGELTGCLIIRAYHQDNGDAERTEMLVPDSAHGTNPATAVLAGFEVVTIPSDARGNVDVAALKGKLGPKTAGLMITNPNTLGLWDEQIQEVIDLVHESGGLVYNDGANFNAILGYARPGDLGIDVMHFNLHKTFSTPHGGGGPGSGPVGVAQKLADFLPGPLVHRRQVDGVDEYVWFTPEKSIGRLHSFHGNFGMFVRALTYIRMHGEEGLRQISTDAVLNANYLKARLEDEYDVAIDRSCMHEVVLSARRQKAQGVKALDIAKRLLDFGVHPPTTYFPLIVPEALMIEPTETESKESLDQFIDALLQIAREAAENPDLVTSAPHTTDFKRLDEAGANRKLNVKWVVEQPELAAAAAD